MDSSDLIFSIFLEVIFQLFCQKMPPKSSFLDNVTAKIFLESALPSFCDVEITDFCSNIAPTML